MSEATDWQTRLRRRARAMRRATAARDADIAAARRAGHSFRELGRWADANHETARTIAIRVNGDSLTQAELDAVDQPVTAPSARA